MSRGLRRQRAAVFAGALALALVSCSPAGETGGERELEPAPAFTLPDLNGRAVSLSDFRGMTVLIDFWATWCGPCEEQIPMLNEFWLTQRDLGQVMVLGVSVDAEGAEVVAPWIEERGVDYPILIGDEGVARSFGTIGFPTLAVVTPDGLVESLHMGLIDRAELEEVVARVQSRSST